MALYINGNKVSGGNADVVHLTQAEYDALPSNKNYDGKVYMITDVNGDGSQFQPVIYSENEREIGVWVDGKPLYEKTNIITNVTDKGWTQIFSDSNANVLSYTGYCLSNTGEKSPLDRYVDNNNKVRTLIYDNGTKVQTEYYNQFNTLASVVATIQYTKTTDVSGSGTWTPQGVPAVHYSTDEQVVGTWIDGKTIYEKTYVFSNYIQVSSSSWTASEIDTSLMETFVKVKGLGVNRDSYDGLITASINNRLNFMHWFNNIGIKTVTVQYTKTQGGT